MAVLVVALCIIVCFTSDVTAAGRGQKCTNPEGKDGESLSESCLRQTCISGIWRTSLDLSVCCSSGVAFSTNTTISTTRSEDGCVKVQVDCVEEGGNAKQVVNIENLYEDLEVKAVILTSTGEAGVQRRSRMGQYARTEQMVYGAPVFAQVARQRGEKQFYLFVGRDGLWRVGPNLASNSGSELKNKKKNEATPPSDGWLYYKDNKWGDVDMHATVHLREDCRRQEGSLPKTELLNTDPSFTNQGILISGGKSDEEEDEDDVDYVWDRDLVNGITTSVEMFLPETGRTCRILDLLDDRLGHTMDWVNNKVVICGGVEEYTWNNCIQFSGGSWVKYATMAKGRAGHTSWVSRSGLVLLSEGAEVVVSGSSARNLGDILNTRESCGINELDSTIITGGTKRTAVERYNEKGFVEKLPDLLVGRFSHGCGSYEKDGSKVLIVAGGKGTNWENLSSTEKLAAGATSWTSVVPLPRRLSDVASVSVRNAVYIIGGADEEKKRSKDIMVFDGESWKKVAEMQWSRSSHAASMVDTRHLIKFCN